MNAIDARMLSVTLGDRQVLNEINLSLDFGKVLALVGPNGAGKSTLVAALAGDVDYRGEIAINGADLESWSGRELARQRAVLLQSNQVAFSFSVRKVIEMGRNPWWKIASPEEDEQAISAAIEMSDVDHVLERVFGSLSGGEKARVSLARVLAQDCPIVLLDEPTAALDLSHQEDVMTIARNLADRGSAVVVVVHDLSLAAAWADEVAMLHQGRLIALGTPEQVLSAERIREVYGIAVHVLTDPNGHRLIVPTRGYQKEQGESS